VNHHAFIVDLFVGLWQQVTFHHHNSATLLRETNAGAAKWRALTQKALPHLFITQLAPEKQMGTAGF
jgi:hypothetical protein